MYAVEVLSLVESELNLNKRVRVLARFQGLFRILLEDILNLLSPHDNCSFQHMSSVFAGDSLRRLVVWRQWKQSSSSDFSNCHINSRQEVVEFGVDEIFADQVRPALLVLLVLQYREIDFLTQVQHVF